MEVFWKGTYLTLLECFGCAPTDSRTRQPSDGAHAEEASTRDGEEAEVTLCFTDLQDSTKLWEAFPHVMSTVIAIHDECMRTLLAAHRGYEVKTEGDAFMISFETVRNAVAFAAALQPALLRCKWPPEIL